MKQLSDFIIPFEWDNRRTILLEKFLYIPPCYSEHDSRIIQWENPAVFEKPQPLNVEFCSGNGQWIAHMAHQMPQFNWIAVEKDFERARKIWLKIFHQNLPNLFLVFGDALTFASHYLPDRSVNEIYVNFPDPWPKRRHEKHRVIQDCFVEQLGRVLIPGRSAILVTDDPATSQRMIDHFSSWKSEFAPANYVTDWPNFKISYFHSLWLQKQRTIRFHRFTHG